MKEVVLIGATGLVGRLTAAYLLEDPRIKKITVAVRRSTGIQHEKLNEVLVDFESISDYRAHIKGDVLISAFGSTMQKAGSKEKFCHYDMDYPLNTAGLALANGCSHFILVSALGASISSPFFYNRCKGMIEKKAREAGFKRVDVIRPSMIIGKRQEKRKAETGAIWLSHMINPFLRGPLARFHGIQAEDLARVMVKLVHEKEDKIQTCFTWLYPEIQQKLKS